MRTATHPYIDIGEPETENACSTSRKSSSRSISADDTYLPKATPLMWVVGPPTATTTVATPSAAVGPRAAAAKKHLRLALLGASALAVLVLLIAWCPSTPDAV